MFILHARRPRPGPLPGGFTNGNRHAHDVVFCFFLPLPESHPRTHNASAASERNDYRLVQRRSVHTHTHTHAMTIAFGNASTSTDTDLRARQS